MNDYTFEDIRKMQDEAKKRVYEMQQRSKAAADNFRGEKNNDLLPDIPKSISMPVDFPAKQKNIVNNNEEKHNRSMHSVLSSFNEKTDSEEAEKMLILALCILLESEHADNALILALMYLMT